MAQVQRLIPILKMIVKARNTRYFTVCESDPIAKRAENAALKQSYFSYDRNTAMTEFNRQWQESMSISE